jgi:DNA-binding transcriptional MocR family regulator
MEDARYLKYLRRLRERIAEAANETVRGLESAGFPVARPLGGGFYVWIELPKESKSADIAAEAAKDGIFIAPSDAFLVSEPDRAGMRVNVAYGANPKFLNWLGRLGSRQKS